jgi:hypothetical protein
MMISSRIFSAMPGGRQARPEYRVHIAHQRYGRAPGQGAALRTRNEQKLELALQESWNFFRK